MNEAVKQILDEYEINSLSDCLWALREIIQQIALLGLWRSKVFEKVAFYGGSALRILYGIDRFSEDLDFSLLQVSSDFSLAEYTSALKRELLAFGFSVEVEGKPKKEKSTVETAFLKANTRKLMLSTEVNQEFIQQVPPAQVLKIKLEVDVNPPSGFFTEMKFLLKPIPFAIRVFTLPDLFAAKMHALLCRQWKSRVKGRDWYDFVWFAGYHPELRLSHLDQRMRQTGHWTGQAKLSEKAFHTLLRGKIEEVNIEQIRREVEPFVKDPASLEVWSKEFFLDVARQIKVI